MESLAQYCFNNTFSTDTSTGTPSNNIPPLDDSDEGETIHTFCALHLSSSDSPSAATSTIFNITLNSASSISYTLVISTIGSQNNAEVEEDIYVGKYKCITRGYCSHMLPNGKRLLKISLCFLKGFTRFNKKT